MVDSAVFARIPSRLAAFSLAVALLFSPAAAQQATPESLARAASLMRQIAGTCASYDVDKDLAARSEKTFVHAGEKAFGKAAFDRILAAEYERRTQEIGASGADRWCADQREALAGAGGAAFFRK